ncbi:MAG: pyridoxal-dependent decarboxylase [Desulfurococcales archaeon]|nr:pyridoxal-dependent decarboxylase [Desulfurococcales archaeon]
MYWRRRGKRRVIATKGSHYSVSKAAYILGMDYREYSIEEIIDNVDPSDVVVATMGKTETGFVDDVDIIYDRVREKGSAIHIDAAYFGSIARFVLRKDLHLDEFMATFAVDLHKIPESPPPAGVLFAFSEEVIEDLWFESPYLPGKRQFGILGTRPGCSVFASSVALRIVMEEWPEGPSGLARDLNSVINDIVRDLSRVGFDSVGGPAPIKCIKHKYIDKIRKYLEDKGYRVYSCLGNGIRIVAMPHNIWQGYKWIKDALITAAEEG